MALCKYSFLGVHMISYIQMFWWKVHRFESNLLPKHERTLAEVLRKTSDLSRIASQPHCSDSWLSPNFTDLHIFIKSSACVIRFLAQRLSLLNKESHTTGEKHANGYIYMYTKVSNSDFFLTFSGRVLVAVELMSESWQIQILSIWRLPWCDPAGPSGILHISP